MPNRPFALLSLLLLSSLLLPACSGRTARTGAPSLAVAATDNPAPVWTSQTPATLSTESIFSVPPTAPSPLPSPEPTVRSRPSVLVVSWDGGGAGQVYGWMDEGLLPHFAELARRGQRAEFALGVDPSLTFPVHNSLASGAFPRRTGIVSNAYHNSVDSFYWYRNGYETPMEAAEPVWVTASHAGLVTASVAFPGSSLSLPSQMADYTIEYGIRDAYSRQERLPLAPAQGWENLPPSFSPVLEADYRIPEVASLHLLACDSTGDGITNYDTVLLIPGSVPDPEAASRMVPEGALKLEVGERGALVLVPALVAGADFLIQEITPQTITFYHTGVYHNAAAPRHLLEGLNGRFGFFPAGADAYALEHGWITEEDYLLQIERLSLWLAGVTAWVWESYSPDLLFTWQENFDAAGHAFLLQNSRQEGYTAERANGYAGFQRQVAQLSDRALGVMLEPVDLERNAVLLVSDHGMAPAHTEVFANTVLERAGLLVLDRRDYVVVGKSQALAVASGGAMNVYINLEGREETGIVSLEMYSDVQQQIADLFASLVDPATGERVFARVLKRAQLAPLGLDHPNSGDVFAQTAAGYSLNGWRGNDEIFAPLKSYGQHGYDCTMPEMRALFIAAGADIPAASGVIPPLRLIDLAPTLAALLGFEPAPAVDGHLIPGLIGR